MTYVQGAVVCIAIIAKVLLLHYCTTINAALLFWAAFIFTVLLAQPSATF